MSSLANKAARFLASEDGPTAVEYAVMLAMIIMTCLLGVQAIGANSNSVFEDIADDMNNLRTGTVD